MTVPLASLIAGAASTQIQFSKDQSRLRLS